MTSISPAGTKNNSGAAGATWVGPTRYLMPSGYDDAAAVHNAIQSLNGCGAVILGPGVFQWNTMVPSFPPFATNIKVMGTGQDATVIKLSWRAPRAFDYGKIADYDVFQNIEICDFTVDNNDVGGQNHVVIGTLVAGSVQRRISINDLTVRRIRTLNVPMDATMAVQRNNIHNCPRFDSTDDAGTIYDHLYEDLDFTDGGANGIVVASVSEGSVQNSVVYDRITLRRCRHDTGALQTTHSFSGNFQIGGRAAGGSAGGSVLLEDCFGINAGDCGLEIDNASTATVNRCLFQDSLRNHYMIVGYGPPADGAEASTILLDHCEAKLENVSLTEGVNYAMGYQLDFGTNPSLQAGHIILRDCKYVNLTTQTPYSDNNAFTYGAAVHAIGVARSITLDRFKAVADQLTLQPSDTQIPLMVALHTNANSNPPIWTRLKIRDMNIRIGGSQTGGAGTTTFYAVHVSGSSSGDYNLLDIDGIDFDLPITGVAGVYPLALGYAASASGHMKGTVRRMTLVNSGDSNSPSNCVLIASSTYLTINDEVLFADCDFRKSQHGAGTEFSIGSGQAAKTRMDKVKWVTWPKPAAAAGTSTFAAGTFTSGTGNQYIGGYSATIAFAAATGTLVTAIDISKDGSTYTNLWTQTAGALAHTVQARVDNGDYIKITFAGGTQPTVTVIPDR